MVYEKDKTSLIEVSNTLNQNINNFFEKYEEFSKESNKLEKTKEYSKIKKRNDIIILIPTIYNDVNSFYIRINGIRSCYKKYFKNDVDFKNKMLEDMEKIIENLNNIVPIVTKSFNNKSLKIYYWQLIRLYKYSNKFIILFNKLSNLKNNQRKPLFDINKNKIL